MPSGKLQIRCREIRTTDLDAVLNLLRKSDFSGSHAFWVRALQRLGNRVPPQGYPQYGLLLEVNQVVVGMLILIATSVTIDGVAQVRCNVSCWYVWPAFRPYGSLLVAQALKHKEATYINISPLQHTFDMLTAQGYTRYCEGSFLAMPALSLGKLTARVSAVTSNLDPGADCSANEIDLMIDHANYGCLSLIVDEGGRRHPFVFELSRKYGIIGYAYLVYCRDINEFVRFAAPLGRFLLRRGFPFVVLDANGPIAGLLGRYADATPKYFKGPNRPRLGDLAYSERAILGLRLAPFIEAER